MKKYEGIPQPQSWDDITIKQFSQYNKLICDYRDFYEKTENKEDSENKILVETIKLNFSICEVFSRLSNEEVYAFDIALVQDYIDNLHFLKKDYEPKEIKYFTFKGVNYNMPQNIGLQTKFGQYIESLQAEMNSKYTDKDSIIYLAHQIAHNVDNGEDWSGEDRDKLAEEFEELPASIGLDFSFFLSKRCLIYSQAYLRYNLLEEESKLPYTRKILLALVGLRRYMSLQRLVFSINLTKHRLIAFYSQILPKFSNIYRILQQKLITKTKLMK